MKNSIYLNVANLESRGSPAGEYRPSSFPKTCVQAGSRWAFPLSLPPCGMRQVTGAHCHHAARGRSQVLIVLPIAQVSMETKLEGVQRYRHLSGEVIMGSGSHPSTCMDLKQKASGFSSCRWAPWNNWCIRLDTTGPEVPSQLCS